MMIGVYDGTWFSFDCRYRSIWEGFGGNEWILCDEVTMNDILRTNMMSMAWVICSLRIRAADRNMLSRMYGLAQCNVLSFRDPFPKHIIYCAHQKILCIIGVVHFMWYKDINELVVARTHDNIFQLTDCCSYRLVCITTFGVAYRRENFVQFLVAEMCSQ